MLGSCFPRPKVADDMHHLELTDVSHADDMHHLELTDVSHARAEAKASSQRILDALVAKERARNGEICLTYIPRSNEKYFTDY